MNKNINIDLQIPIVLILFLIVGIGSAFFLNRLVTTDFREKYIIEIFNSCEKIGLYYYKDKIIKCEIKK